jgi:hypothetical protein
VSATGAGVGAGDDSGGVVLAPHAVNNPTNRLARFMRRICHTCGLVPRMTAHIGAGRHDG